ncbi:MAG: ABC transporter ATP-binding protein [Planctomycetota bacterium]
MLEAKDLHRWFGRHHAVRGVSFRVAAGQALGLLGPNGAGKSTTIRMLAGVLAPHRGKGLIDGKCTVSDPLHARRAVGYLPESAAVYSDMTVRSAIAFRASLYGLGGRDRRNAVDRAIDRCRLGEVPGRKRLGALSKGFRQRVALACAMVHDPKVLILDEPTNGLDPTQLRDARSLIAGLAEQRTVVICSHVLPEIERLCERVVVVGGGRVLADRPIDQLGAQAEARCIIELRSDASDTPTLTGLPNTAHVEQLAADHGWSRFAVTSTELRPDELREAVGRAAAGRTVRELRDDRPGLEQAVLAMLESADGPPADQPEPRAGSTEP